MAQEEKTLVGEAIRLIGALADSLEYALAKDKTSAGGSTIAETPKKVKAEKTEKVNLEKTNTVAATPATAATTPSENGGTQKTITPELKASLEATVRSYATRFNARKPLTGVEALKSLLAEKYKTDKVAKLNETQAAELLALMEKEIKAADEMEKLGV